MHTLLATVVVASLAYAGTMFDNFFAFAAQLLVTDESHHRRVAVAQALGVLSLLVISLAVGSLLDHLPIRWIGLMALLPWTLAVHSFGHRHDPVVVQPRRGSLTTFTVTIALGGDNLAVWIPLLRANGSLAKLTTVIVFAVGEIIFLASARALVTHPRVVAWGTRFAPILVPAVYLGLGVLILVECGTFG